LRFEEFQAVMRSGFRVSSTHFTAHIASHEVFLAQGWATSRIGALLPKRLAKQAARRNLLRRQIYAHARQYLPQLTQHAQQPLACVVRLRSPWAAADFSSAQSAALRLAVRLELQTLFMHALQKTQANQGGRAAAATISSAPTPERSA